MKTLVLALAVVVAAALPAEARVPLDTISRYLNGLETAAADFTQINPDGTIATGRLFIKRPGRMRFEYNPPEPTLVVVGGGQVAIFDGKSNKVEPEQYPLAQTPLNIILERNVDLSRRSMVVGHSDDGTATTVVAQDPARPEYGRLELVFTPDPVELRQWVVVDGSGQRTTVVLGALTKDRELSSTLFNIPYEVDRRRN